MRKTENTTDQVPVNASRRNFVAGLGVVALAAAVAPLTGCQPEATPTEDDNLRQFFNFIVQKGGVSPDEVTQGVLTNSAARNANGSYEFWDIGNFMAGPVGQNINLSSLNKPVANSDVQGIPQGMSVTALDVAVYASENPNYARALYEQYNTVPTSQTFELLKQHIDEERKALPDKVEPYADNTQAEINAFKQLLNDMAGRFPAIAKQAGYPDKIQPTYIAEGTAAAGGISR